MSDNPLDSIPAYDRVSIRAVVVLDGEDPSQALTQAGIFDAIALPVAFGEGQPDGSFGDGITPNLTAVVEHDQSETDASNATPGAHGLAFNNPALPAGSQPGAAGSRSHDVLRPGPVTASLPAADGMRPMAPVRPRSGTRTTANRVGGA